jgi:iron complex outermembrane receptor protein
VLLLNGNSASATVNVPDAEVTGVEGDFQIKPTEWLHVGGSVAYQDARYTDNQATLFGLHVAFGPFADAPRYTGSIYDDITIPLGDSVGTLTYHTEFYAQSSQYFGNLGVLSPGTELPGYGLVNMRLDWAHPFGVRHVTVSGFVKNLANKLYWTGGAAGALTGSIETAEFGAPRTYGFVLRGDF